MQTRYLTGSVNVRGSVPRTKASLCPQGHSLTAPVETANSRDRGQDTLWDTEEGKLPAIRMMTEAENAYVNPC